MLSRVAIAVALASALVACKEKKTTEAPEDLPPLDTSCESDDDCVPAPACCPGPCTSNVINRDDLDEARRRVEARCPEDPDCPDAGDCQTHMYVCEDSRCQITYHGDPAYERRQNQQPGR